MSTDYDVSRVLKRGVCYIFHVAKDDIERFEDECDQRELVWEWDENDDGSATFRVRKEPTPEQVQRWIESMKN